MTIPDEAVQAASKRIDDYYDTPNCVGETAVRAALTASLPFLQGVKVKALKWKQEDNGDVISESFVGWYHIGLPYRTWNLTTPQGQVLSFHDLNEAKAAAQADYEARIISALEPFANSYPQGANLAAHSKNENGPDHEPSPRAQALEEAAQAVEALKGRSHSPQVLQGFGDARREAAAAIRALSSQPVADGWLPIETAPKDGTNFDVWMMPHGYREPDVYWSNIQETWCRDGGCLEELNTLSPRPYPTHWRPLPASPVASTTRPTGGSNHGE